MRYLGCLVLLFALFAAGCSPAQTLDLRRESYSLDPTKSYALNMIHALTLEEPGVYDSPQGGGFLRSPGAAPEPQAGNRLGDAALVGVDSATANSLSSFGISSGTEGALAGGLFLLDALMTDSEPSETPMIGKSYLIFGWIPKDGKTQEQAKEEIMERVIAAMKAAVAEYPLPEGFSFDGVDVVDESKDIYWAYPPSITAKVSGGFCDGGDYSCAYRIWFNKAYFAIGEGKAPENMGGRDSWVFSVPPARFALPLKSGNVAEKMLWEQEDLPLFPEAPFFKELSKHLPENYFFHIPPESRCGCSPAPTETGELACLQKPVLLHQGEEHYFITPTAQAASAQ